MWVQIPPIPFNKMAYEQYKKIITKEEFYDEWEEDKLVQLTEKLREYVYNKHIVKCKILQRDNFTCQNRDKDGKCSICNNVQYPEDLTWHHIKAKRNGGENKERNGVTLCNGIHRRYEKAKGSLVFPKDALNLPPHIRGHTFKLEQPSEINWKKKIFEMRALRKELKAQGIRPSFNWDEIAILLRWLFIPYDEFDECD